MAEKVDNELFRIFLEPLEGIHVASSEYDVGNSFIVYYPALIDNGLELNEKSVRIHIAHELGHLYTHVLLNSSDFSAEVLDKNETTEIISTLVAMVVLRDKRDFYLNVQHKEALSHKNTEDLVRDCLQIHGQRDDRAIHTS